MYYVVTQDVMKENITKEMMMPHIEYMHKLFASRKIVISGPFSDDKGGGMFILEGKRESDVNALIGKDPAVQAGILKNNIRLYDLKFLRN